MARHCDRCKRLNPDDALYCFHDGQALVAEAVSSMSIKAARIFASPLLLPTGDACVTYDDFLEFCQENWAVGAECLRSGLLTAFFQMIGRSDLSQAARAAAALADSDIGLHDLLKALPSKAVPPPKLHASPPEIEHKLKVGEDVAFDLRLGNAGGRLLYGTVTTECPWLSLGSHGVVPRKDFKFQRDGAVSVRICGRLLGASARPREAVLDVSSNGGEAKTIVRVRVDARPFAGGVLTGVASPRDLVERVRQAPTEAAPWLADGSIARWYRDNGWTFPVQHRLPAGLDAVRQFFAALGLPDRFEDRSEDPFAGGPLAGVSTPRELVERTRRAPAQIAPWFANGAVARWYTAHRWAYPVKEAPAAGDGAVRQFFAALGQPDPFAPAAPAAPAAPLPAAPRAPAAPVRPVAPVPASRRPPLRLEGVAGARVAHQLTVQARPNGVRPTSARASSDRPWLQIASTEVEASTATVILMVPSVPNLPGKTLDARVSLTLNDIYQTIVRVSLFIAAAS